MGRSAASVGQDAFALPTALRRGLGLSGTSLSACCDRIPETRRKARTTPSTLTSIIRCAKIRGMISQPKAVAPGTASS
jgi:hypothetical protein